MSKRSQRSSQLVCPSCSIQGKFTLARLFESKVWSRIFFDPVDLSVISSGEVFRMDERSLHLEVLSKGHVAGLNPTPGDFQEMENQSVLFRKRIDVDASQLPVGTEKIEVQILAFWHSQISQNFTFQLPVVNAGVKPSDDSKPKSSGSWFVWPVIVIFLALAAAIAYVYRERLGLVPARDLRTSNASIEMQRAWWKNVPKTIPYQRNNDMQLWPWSKEWRSETLHLLCFTFFFCKSWWSSQQFCRFACV